MVLNSASVSEYPAARKDRDWDAIGDDRKVRGLDKQTAERKSRQYVNPDTWVSDVNGQAPHGEGYLGDGYYTSSDPIVKGEPFPQGIAPDSE